MVWLEVAMDKQGDLEILDEVLFARFLGLIGDLS